MTRARSRRNRRLAFVGASTAAAMVLLPGTALAGPNLFDDPFGFFIDPLSSPASPFLEPLETVNDELAAHPLDVIPLVGPAVQNPLLGNPDNDDDSPGHETDDPLTPDHAAGENIVWEFGEENDTELFNVNRYDASANSDGSTGADVSLFGLFGDELIGSHSNSAGPTSQHSNATEFLCEGTGGALCLSLLYTDTAATQDNAGSAALARGGVAAACLGGSNGDADATNECENSFLSLGVEEAVGSITRSPAGDTTAASSNNAVNVCLLGDAVPDSLDALPALGEAIGSDTAAFCDGFGLRLLPAGAAAGADENSADNARDSEFLVFDGGGNGTEVLNDAMSFALPMDCGDPSLICSFFNQGEDWVFQSIAGNPGAAAAQEAAHLDLLKGTPLHIQSEGYKADALARSNPADDGECDPNGNDPDCDQPEECADGIDNDGDGRVDLDDPDCSSPEDDSESGDAECNDGIDNDGDGKVDFGVDPGCASADDDSEADSLAATGADAAPMLAAALALIGFGALTVAGSARRRTGRHSA